MTRQILDAFLSEQGQTWYLIGTFDGEQLVGLYKQGYFSEWSTGYSFQILWGEPDLSDLNNVIGALSHV